MMLYSFGHFVVLCSTRAWAVEAVFPHIPLCGKLKKNIFFANFVSSVLAVSPWLCFALNVFNLCSFTSFTIVY